MRRPYLYVCLCLAALLPLSRLQAQTKLQVMDWKGDATLNTYLVQQMQAQYHDRQLYFQEAIATPKKREAYIARVRAKYRALLGGLPQKSPLNAVITGTIQRKGYRIEKLSYESFPNHHVTANLYLPEGRGPFAAVLFPCGHEDEAKATASYQRTAILFARYGMAVLVIDPVSQAERYQLVDAAGKPITRGGTTEHTLLNATAALFGGSTAADELWDNVRGLDYLVTRKEIDTARIGCLGNSGGGMQTMYLAAFEPRIKVLAVCSYLSTREHTLELDGPADGCAQIPGEGAAELELADYLIAAAPRPVLILAGKYDFINYSGTVAATEELKKFYGAGGYAERVSLFTCEDGHGISQPKREAALRWFRRWFYQEAPSIDSNFIPVLMPGELAVTDRGQVMSSYPGEVSLPQRNLALFDTLSSRRQKFLQLPRAQITDTLKTLLAMDTAAALPYSEYTGTAIKSTLAFLKLVFRRKGQPPVPALMIWPVVGSGRPKSLHIFLPDEGKTAFADSVSLLQHYLLANEAVMLADLRGLGETEDKATFNDPKYYNREYRNDLLALHVGRNIVGERVADIQTLLSFYTADTLFKNIPITVHASGRAALPALFAAAITDGSQHWELSLPFTSYHFLLDHPDSKNMYPYIVPRILRYSDLPDLLRLAGHEKVTLVHP